jgi:superfamily I DNA and/or RNA helicase/very-short-patch-repair endonuclease
MPNQSDRILQYLRYLRDVSRKIVTRNGFEKCYFNKQNRYAYPIIRHKENISNFDAEYETYNWYYEQVRSNQDKKLFIGFGLLCGSKQKKIISAPIIYIQCEIDKTEDNTIVLTFADTANINYDLIASISDKSSTDDDDIFTPSTTNQTLVLEKLEDEILKCNTFSKLSDFSQDAFLQLRIDFDDFKNIEVSKDSLDYKAEINNHLSNKANSLFKGKLKFYPSNYSFIADIPDQLSTYQALHSFVENIEQTGEFKNPVLEKLLVNALSDKKTTIGTIQEDRINSIINNVIPLSLSSSQRQAIQNVWQNEVSYIQGPPGTGKSHTISAILLSALAMNKKVLVVSQKQPALEVVNQKINPLLSDDEELTGVIYFDKDSKRKIKEYIGKITNLSTHSGGLFSKWTHLSANIQEFEDKIKAKQSSLKKYEEQLIQNLKFQQEFKEKNELLDEEAKRFSKNFEPIPNKHPFKIIKKKEEYQIASDTVKRIYNTTKKPFSANLYLHKYKKHLADKYTFPKEWFSKSSFPILSEKYLDLHIVYTETQKIREKIIYDETGLRSLIKELNIDLEKLKLQLIKLTFKQRLLKTLQHNNLTDDLEQFGKMLHWTNSKIVLKRMNEINFSNIVNLFPFWTAEIRNLGQLFPLEHNLFDLIIVDEASQVNLAEVLPVFYRGKNICIVGDHNQLNLKATGLSFGLTTSFDEKIWNKYNGNYLQYSGAEDKFLVVKKASILDFIRSPHYNFPIREVMLEEHFRSLPQLARYTSKTFYKDENNPNNTEGKLKIMTETPDKLALQCFKGYFVNGKRDTENNNKVVIKEAETTIQLIKFLINPNATKNELFEHQFDFPKHVDSTNFTIGVISIIRDQCELIKDKINDSFNEDIRQKYNLMVGTPEEFQGSERDIIIISLCLDENCKGGHGHFQDKQRFNVATSRAKSFTYFLYSKFPLSFNVIHTYLNSLAGGVEFKDQPAKIEIKKLPQFNPEKLESDFERQVHYWLTNYTDKRNKSNNSITIHNQIVSCGQRRLDFVLYNEHSKKSVVVEVDGSYHFNKGSLKQNYTEEHLERMEILQRAGWKIINTPYYKWYKDGWLSETSEPVFKEEIERIYKELDRNLFD